jgi:acyl carrier protein
MTDSEKLDRAYRTSLGLGDQVDLSETGYGVTDGWDSIAHMQLVAAIEATFDIMMDTDDVVAMNSYRVAKRILRDNHGLDLDA